MKIDKIKKKGKSDEFESLINNKNLNENQKLFCIHYIKCFNATKAYQKTYGCGYETAMVNGSRLLVNAKIKEEIENLKRYRFNRAMVSEDDIFQKYIDIAFADINDYLEYGKKDISVVGQDGKIETLSVNYVDFKESKNVDGSVVSEISQGKDGVKLKFYDKLKALQWLGDRMDLLPTSTQIRVENEKIKLELEALRLEHEIAKNSNVDEEFEDDGFKEAMTSQVEEVWDDK